ncbi:hypothetical protein ACTJI2_05170 [Pseudoxanthomonas sp. 22568]|uniref:hypothetical protein n=1 Tax=Pseudoxanthomonas TaxID=83618 RepID=UPI0017863067|nr:MULTISPECIES: hypothetical protein [Pseudoxanthomonas]UBB26976.1 hypothetical protein LAG73_07855 [Pseudoxanthomonas japonensis]
MEYHIPLPGPSVDPITIERVLQEFDPAGLVDLDAKAGKLRISTVVMDIELVFIMEQAGHPVRLTQIERIASVCCGGCSG